MQRCTLLIPHLWWSRDAGAEVYRDLSLPALRAVVTRARHSRFAAVEWEAWLCQAFEVERQRDWPVAPLTLTIDGAEPGDGYWLRADPVHLRPHRDRLVLADSSAFEIPPAEAAALIDALNAHFEVDGLRYSAPHPDRWYLRLESDPQIATCPLDAAAGAIIDPYLLRGANAMQWHRISNEAQMLLHAHEVNQAREARGELTINGVWFWGGGHQVAVPGRHFSTVTGDDPLAVALATNADVATLPLPRSAAAWLRSDPFNAGSHHLVVLGALTSPARRGDLEAWRDALAALDADWIAPLLSALRGGKIAEFALVAPGSEVCQRFELHRADLLRFWRMRRSLTDFAPRSVA
ncbi:MAG: phosphoglycerate mutase [Burkholderiales bacterium]|jgi:hypothetical protein|nr:phosphoglycerate mutase [Burkholderiales bacterium]